MNKKCVEVDVNLSLGSIALLKRQAVLIADFLDDFVVKQIDNSITVMTLNHEFMRLGYIMSEELFNKFKVLPISDIAFVGGHVIETLKYMKGDHVIHKPMYPNFPKQVMDMNMYELLLNQLVHYWSFGTLLPEYEKIKREFQLEAVTFKKLIPYTTDEAFGIFTSILKSNDSITSFDKKIIEYFINNSPLNKLNIPDVIPYKENMCIVAGLFLNKALDINVFVKNATDILRIATYLSGGDVSLATNTKFKSLPRTIRKVLVMALENVINEEDIKRHKNKWVRLFHNLHVGDYSSKVYNIASKPRSNETLYSIAGKIEQSLKDNYIQTAVDLLQKRPGDFARKLDYLLRKFPENNDVVVNGFSKVVDKVATRVLLQVVSHFANRGKEGVSRIIMPKSLKQAAYRLPAHTEPISEYSLENLMEVIEDSLYLRFNKLPAMGLVYIDERLKNCPVPTQLRSSSKNTNVVARGTRFPLNIQANILRFFVYWKGMDIDLSATLHDKDFKAIEQISWTHLRDHKYGGYHSGDITRAYNGASEFIDLDLNKLKGTKAKYIAMNLYVYNGPTFKNHEICFAGWMTRTHAQANEIFDPKTVEDKFDLTVDSNAAIPVLFDIEKREAIWCDIVDINRIAYNSNYYGRRRNNGNTVETNKVTIEHTLSNIVTMKRFNLYDLFTLHAEARNAMLVSKFPEKEEDVKYIFDLYKCINPTSTDIINAEYVI